MITPLIHIGYHKTASSWLQSFLFNNQYARFVSVSRDDIKNNLVYVNSLDLDPQKARNYFKSIILNAENQGLIPVFSEERLSGSPHSGGYDSKELANRLSEVFPGGRVLIVIREQKNMILSVYKQYIRGVGGACSLNSYLNPPPQKKFPLFELDHFKYHRLVSHYMILFGKSNVLVLPYEMIKENSNDFLRAIINFSGGRLVEKLPFSEKVNSSLSGFAINIKRLLNPFVMKNSLNLGNMLFLPPEFDMRLDRALCKLDSFLPVSFRKAWDRRFKSMIFNKVGDRYKESNRILSDLTNLNLVKYGYDV